MITLIFTGIVGIVIITGFILFIRNAPDFWFWLFLNLYFDPGGYIDGYLGGKPFGPLNITDVIIVGIIICTISARINWKVIYGDQLFTKFLFFLLIFSVYYFIVYGGAVPYFHNDFDYLTFLIKNRMYAYGFIILISVYVFSLRDLKYFYTITLSIGLICLSFYMITLLTGFELMFVWDIERRGTGMTRLMMLGYGIFDLIFPLALTVYLLSRKISMNLEYKSWLYLGGFLMIITELLTLTRRVQIDLIGTSILIVLIISYLFRTGKLTGILKLAIPSILIIVILYLTLPEYGGYIAKTAEDTFLLITTGEDSEGRGDERVTGTGALEVTKEYIKNNLLFGTGYTYLYWGGTRTATSPRGATYARAADAAGEVPIYYVLFGFGIAGAILMIPLYFLMGTLFFRLIKLLKLTLINYLEDPLTIIFSIYILLIIAQKFTYQLWGLGGDFFISNLSKTVVLTGLGFALYRKIFLNYYLQDANK